MSDPKVLKANEDLLNQIHRKVADRILKDLENEECDNDTLNIAIRFLKDNNIKADPAFNPSVVKVLDRVVDVKKLPFQVLPKE